LTARTRFSSHSRSCMEVNLGHMYSNTKYIIHTLKYISQIWNAISNIQFTISNIQFTISNVHFTTSKMQYTISNIQHINHNIQFLIKKKKWRGVGWLVRRDHDERLGILMIAIFSRCWRIVWGWSRKYANITRIKWIHK